ncbi:hypothetical protein D3C87_1619540 [compost metagenome]
MKTLLLVAVLLAGCATAPTSPPRRCPPLPELAARATEADRANHYATVIQLYAQCAGASP